MMHLQDYFTAQENVMLPLIAKGASNREASSKALDLLSKVGWRKRSVLTQGNYQVVKCRE
jgi:predicted ABC-type transport system involved in lysophospholipase L1 biosynthesis ATPase subunit